MKEETIVPSSTLLLNSYQDQFESKTMHSTKSKSSKSQQAFTPSPSPTQKKRTPTAFRPFNLSSSNRKPESQRTPSRVHKVPSPGYFGNFPSTTPTSTLSEPETPRSTKNNPETPKRMSTPSSQKSGHLSSLKKKLIDFPPSNKTKEDNKGIDIRKGTEEVETGKEISVDIEEKRGDFSDNGTGIQDSARNGDESKVHENDRMKNAPASLECLLVHLSPNAVSTISEALQRASPTRAPRVKVNPSLKSPFSSPAQLSINVSPTRIPIRRFQRNPPPALELTDSVDDGVVSNSTSVLIDIEKEKEQRISPPSSSNKVAERRDDLNKPLSPQEGEREQKFPSLVARKQTLIINPTPIRQAIELENDLLGHMRELKDPAKKLLPFEKEELVLQRQRHHREEIQRRQGIENLEQKLKEKDDEVQLDETMSKERILNLERDIQCLKNKSEGKDKDFTMLQNEMQLLKVAVKEQEAESMKFTGGVINELSFFKLLLIFLWKIFCTCFIRLPFEILKTTLVFGFSFTLLGMTYSYLCSQSDNILGVF